MNRIGIPNVSEEQIRSVKRKQYMNGYENSAPRGTVGIAAALGKCWDSGKDDKSAGLASNPRCGDVPIGGNRKRRLRKTKKQSKKRTKRATRKH